jgi:hypothetical protein
MSKSQLVGHKRKSSSWKYGGAELFNTMMSWYLILFLSFFFLFLFVVVVVTNDGT